MLSTNVGRVIGLGKEIVKERADGRAEQGNESALDAEFVSAMKSMGEGIKTFIHAYRESFKTEQRARQVK